MLIALSFISVKKDITTFGRTPFYLIYCNQKTIMSRTKTREDVQGRQISSQNLQEKANTDPSHAVKKAGVSINKLKGDITL